MSTATTVAAVEIVCPHWCTVSAQEHADELWNQGGVVVHHMQEMTFADDEGFTRSLDDALPASAFNLGLTTITTPDHRPQAASVYLDGREVTVKQAEEIAAALSRWWRWPR